MAKKKADIPMITIVGQSKSGKTNMLASMLHNRQAHKQMEMGETPLESAAFFPQADLSPAEESVLEEIGRHYRSMLRGLDLLHLEGTREVRQYNCILQNTEMAVPEKKGWRSKSAAQKIQINTPFILTDGRGGDIAPEEAVDPEDETTMSRRVAYRDAADRSIGHVVCMPIQTEEYRTEVIQRFLRELRGSLKRKAEDRDLPPLKRIAICYTKYEMPFMEFGVDARVAATDPDEFIRTIKESASFADFVGFLGDSDVNEIETRIFPVSCFGFVKTDGSANFYNYPYAPGLMTRAIDEHDDYENRELPNYKDHFPLPLTEGQAAGMWEPFNAACPFLYALTGRVTGPLSVTVKQVQNFKRTT